MKIPVSHPLKFFNTKKYLNFCAENGWFSSGGSYVKDFENKFAKYIGVKYALTSTSGTSALHLALKAINIKKDDEVILSTFTMVAPAFAIAYCGAKPILVDCEPDTWVMNTADVEKKITKKTKAIITVHIYGHPVDMEPLQKLANKYRLILIEDAAEGLGAHYKNKKIGVLSDIACFSFYANKLITTGEGGMLVTNNKKIADRIRLLRDMAHSPEKRFLHTEIGFNYRMSNLQAAVGLAYLEQINFTVNKKREIASLYNSYLSKTPGLILPIEKPWAKNVYWMYGVLINKDFKLTRDLLRIKLFEKGVDTRDFFVPVHLQPALKKLGYFKNESYPVSEFISQTGLYLPSGPAISDNEIKKICQIIYKLSK